MKIGHKIYSTISFLGNTKGVKNEPIVLDTFDFAISEGDSDVGAQFILDSNNKGIFFIEENKISLKQGVKYKFRGIGNNSSAFEPVVTIPVAIDLDTVITEIVSSEKVNNLIKTVIRCNIKLNGLYPPGTYLHITPTSESDKAIKATFENNFQAYKQLNHREGFLVDFDRISNNSLQFYLVTEEFFKPKFINFEFGNVSQSFYQFNHYKSNLSSGINYSALDPAIAGFNVVTDKALGSFSATTSFVKRYSIN